MSSTNRGSQRSEADAYATPSWCVDRLLSSALGGSLIQAGGVWLDPCAGDGAIIRAVRMYDRTREKDIKDKLPHRDWLAVELRDTKKELDAIQPKVRSFTKTDYFSWKPTKPIDVILTNPPYRLAQEFIERACQQAPVVAMLLRLNFLGSEKRYPLFAENPPDVGVLPNRPPFTQDGHTDSIEYAWFVFRRGLVRSYGRLWVLAPTPLAERRHGRRALLV